MNSPLNEVLNLPDGRQRLCKHQCTNCGGTIIRSGQCESCGGDDIAITCFDGSAWHSYLGSISKYYSGEQEASRIIERYCHFGLPVELPPFFTSTELDSLLHHYNEVELALSSPGWIRNDVTKTVVVYGAIEADVVLSLKRKQTTVTFVNTVSSKLSPISFCNLIANDDGKPDYKKYINSNSQLMTMDPGHQLNLWLAVKDGLGNEKRLDVSIIDPIVIVMKHSLMSSGQVKNCYQISGRLWGQVDVSQ